MARKRLEKSKCFALFDLPFVPLQSVLNSISFINLFDLSSCSKKGKEIVKCHLRTTFRIDIQLHGTIKTFWFFTENGDLCGNWNFNFKCEKFNGQREEFRTIDGHKFRFQKLEFFAYSNCSRPDITMRLVLSRFQEIFNCQLNKVEVWTDDLSPLSSYLVGVTNCKKFICDGRDNISDKDLQFLLEKLEVSEKLELSVDINGCNFKCENAKLTAKCVEIKHWADWLTAKSFLSSDFETMRVVGCNFPMETYELFVSRWMSGSFYQKLRYVRIRNQEQVELEVLKSRGAPWDPEKRSRYFLTDDRLAIDCSEGTDISRADGKLATVLTNDKKFQMFVWHERFPVLTERHRIVGNHQPI